jgi:hypothetical protein
MGPRDGFGVLAFWAQGVLLYIGTDATFGILSVLDKSMLVSSLTAGAVFGTVTAGVRNNDRISKLT